ncbi:transmembrane protein 220-like isoform X2 [Pomacea canaliculata]|nr:transmembrane protein 220-like isoform X2 [Pomacea canaliculata]
MATHPELSTKNKSVTSHWFLVWRGISLFMTVFFLLASAVNINDGDWYIWVPIYLIPAVLASAIVIRPDVHENRVWSTLAVIHFAFCLAYTVYQVVLLIEAITGELKNPLEHEEGREMAGLLIIMAWLGICRFTNLGRPDGAVSNRSLMNALLLLTVMLAVIPLGIWSLCFVHDWHTKLGHCKGMFQEFSDFEKSKEL